MNCQRGSEDERAADQGECFHGLDSAADGSESMITFV
jgi:hypothetical protein